MHVLGLSLSIEHFVFFFFSVLPPAFTAEHLAAAAATAAANNNASSNEDDFEDSSISQQSQPPPPPLQSSNAIKTENSSVLQTATDNKLLKQSLELIATMQCQMNNNFKDESIDDDEFDDLSWDETLLNEHDLAFNIQSPTMVPSYLNYHYVCECGSRLLFLSVYWIKQINVFKMLQ